jgi:hypothetical protein
MNSGYFTPGLWLTFVAVVAALVLCSCSGVFGGPRKD